jgi:hypothetical protein
MPNAKQVKAIMLRLSPKKYIPIAKVCRHRHNAYAAHVSLPPASAGSDSGFMTAYLLISF